MSVPQKNSGNKNKGQSAARTNHIEFISDYMNELQTYGIVKDIYLAKICRVLGNSRVEVQYQKIDCKDGDPHMYSSQAVIPGKFQGKNKRYFWIENGALVLVADTGLKLFEVVGMVDNNILETMKKYMKINTAIAGDGEEEDALFAEADLDIDGI